MDLDTLPKIEYDRYADPILTRVQVYPLTKYPDLGNGPGNDLRLHKVFPGRYVRYKSRYLTQVLGTLGTAVNTLPG